MDASEFAVHLDHIREGRENVSKDYSEPERFFDRTYLTESLLELCSQVVRRLSGIQRRNLGRVQHGHAVRRRQDALADYHLPPRQQRREGQGVEGRGPDSWPRPAWPQVPKADVAVFVGTEFDVLKGRGGDGEPVRKTPWGEIAWQLGREAGICGGCRSTMPRVSPRRAMSLRAMLPAGPTLILMDELLNYISRGRKLGLRGPVLQLPAEPVRGGPGAEEHGAVRLDPGVRLGDEPGRRAGP